VLTHVSMTAISPSLFIPKIVLITRFVTGQNLCAPLLTSFAVSDI
jgi:hypothetical protein